MLETPVVVVSGFGSTIDASVLTGTWVEVSETSLGLASCRGALITTVTATPPVTARANSKVRCFQLRISTPPHEHQTAVDFVA